MIKTELGGNAPSRVCVDLSLYEVGSSLCESTRVDIVDLKERMRISIAILKDVYAEEQCGG